MQRITEKQIRRIQETYTNLVSVVNEYGLCQGKLRESFLEYKLSIARFLANPADKEIPKDIIAAMYWIEIYNRLLGNLFVKDNGSMDENSFLGKLITNTENSLYRALNVYYQENDTYEDTLEAIRNILGDIQELSLEMFTEKVIEAIQ